MLSITSRELFKAHGGSQRWWNNYDTTGGRVSFYQSEKEKKRKVSRCTVIIIGREGKAMGNTAKIRISKWE